MFNFQGLCWVYATLAAVSFGQRVLFQGRRLPSIGESLIKRIIKKINVISIKLPTHFLRIITEPVL